jgi:tRNA(fMet)-specific endonuclease VapC
MYLLDTNTCVEYLRGRNALVRQRLANTPIADVRLCSVVLAELYIGALRSARPARNRAKIDGFVQPYQSVPFDDTAANIHSQIRHHLEKLGTPIGPYDLQIAAIALVHGLTVVTHNTAEYSRVPNLMIEDWEIP